MTFNAQPLSDVCFDRWEPMRASIIILTFNQLEEGTRPCIESLYNTPIPADFELIIVDNASLDGTPDFLKIIRKKI